MIFLLTLLIKLHDNLFHFLFSIFFYNRNLLINTLQKLKSVLTIINSVTKFYGITHLQIYMNRHKLTLMSISLDWKVLRKINQDYISDLWVAIHLYFI